MYEECNYFTSSGEKLCSKPMPGTSIQNPKICTYEITLEESKWKNSCEPKIDNAVLLEKIIDADPFTELYICDTRATLTELNKIIDNDELNSKCKKLI